MVEMVALIYDNDESFIEIKLDQRRHDPTTNGQQAPRTVATPFLCCNIAYFVMGFKLWPSRERMSVDPKMWRFGGMDGYPTAHHKYPISGVTPEPRESPVTYIKAHLRHSDLRIPPICFI